MTPIRLVVHAPGAPGLRWLGLGPDLRPCRALLKLQRLFDRLSFFGMVLRVLIIRPGATVKVAITHMAKCDTERPRGNCGEGGLEVGNCAWQI